MIKTILEFIGINKIQLIVGAIIISFLSGLFLYQHYTIKNLREEYETTKISLSKYQDAYEKQQIEIKSLEEQHNKLNKVNKELNNEINSIEKQNALYKSQTNAFRGRLSEAAKKKPSLVEKRANAAIVDLMQQFEGATTN